MSIANLKSRMTDVPGIEGLTMRLEAGRMLVAIGDRVVAVDPLASDPEIEAAIRKSDQPKGITMSVTGAKFAGLNLKTELQAVRAQMQASTAKMAEAISDMKEAANAHGQLADAIKGEAAELKADMAEFTNGDAA